MRTTELASILGVILASLFPASAPTPSHALQSPDLTALAAQVSKSLEQSKQKSIAVFDFYGPELLVSALGRNMADQFSTDLGKSGANFIVMDRAQVNQSIESNRFAPEIIAEPEILMWLAQAIGAESAVIGKVAADGEGLILTVDCFQAKGGKMLGSFRTPLSLTEEMKSGLAKNVDSDSEITRAAGAKTNSGASTPVPTCSYCPNPQLSKAAEKNKTQGTVLLMTIVGADGRARDIKVIRRLPDGLTLNAVRMVQQWKFHPAKGSDGTAMDVRTPIEITFRLY